MPRKSQARKDHEREPSYQNKMRLADELWHSTELEDLVECLCLYREAYEMDPKRFAPDTTCRERLWLLTKDRGRISGHHAFKSAALPGQTTPRDSEGFVRPKGAEDYDGLDIVGDPVRDKPRTLIVAPGAVEKAPSGLWVPGKTTGTYHLKRIS